MVKKNIYIKKHKNLNSSTAHCPLRTSLVKPPNPDTTSSLKKFCKEVWFLGGYSETGHLIHSVTPQLLHSLLSGLPASFVHSLQCMQNCAACLILSLHCTQNCAACLIESYQKHIKLTISLLCFSLSTGSLQQRIQYKTLGSKKHKWSERLKIFYFLLLLLWLSSSLIWLVLFD